MFVVFAFPLASRLVFILHIFICEKKCHILISCLFVRLKTSLQCRRILGGRNLVRVRSIVVAAIFDFMAVEDWGESEISRANCALKENACTAG